MIIFFFFQQKDKIYIVFFHKVRAPKGEDWYSGKSTTCGIVLGKKNNSQPQVLKKKEKRKSNKLPKVRRKRTWLFDRPHALELIQAKSGPSLWKPTEPPWDPAQKSQEVSSKTKSCHKYHPRTTYSFFAFSPLVATAVCTLKRSYFSATGESLWKGMRVREQKVSGHCKQKQNSQGNETSSENIGE